ncbi:exported protein [Candidatus Thiomargarita nelsonii]|uniref:Exported protein n=1 Tax=Candidatus Thiomargarita nelsonii TaxID=1003181 RepID=A0A176S895_9GAMM|nr:exported protein [Candidatus Thiomargarita nelsonii]
MISKMLIKRHKKLIFSIITFFFSLIVIIVSSEFLLRLTEHLPYRPRDSAINPVAMYEQDSKLGWKNKEGKYPILGYVQNSKEITFSTGGTWTFLPGGMRSTGGGQLDKPRKLVIVGGSFTQGYGVSDNETYPWKLQSKYPSVQVLNYGTSGYGTYQSLLALERIFSKSVPPVIVLYGFIGHHEVRNVAPYEWLEAIARKYSSLPYCTIDYYKNNLIRHSPESYPVWPLREKLAIVNFFQKQYMKLKTIGRGSQKRRVTEKLLLEMNSLCKNNSTKFAVVLLSCKNETKSHYIKFLKNNHINYIDCVYPLTPDKRLSWDRWHPNGVMNTLWADCIGEALGDTITQVGR